MKIVVRPPSYALLDSTHSSRRVASFAKWIDHNRWRKSFGCVMKGEREAGKCRWKEEKEKLITTFNKFDMKILTQIKTG